MNHYTSDASPYAPPLSPGPYRASSDSASKELGPPTRARFGVLGFLCTLALLLYVDRVCIGQAASAIRAELGLSLTQMGWVFNAFTLAYCLFEVPTGHLADRYGSRRIIARIVLWWSMFTALTGASMGLMSLVAVRFLFGAGEAGAFPNVARVVTQWFPPGERGRVRGLIATISFVGAAAAPPLAAFLISLIDWRWTFAVFGIVGVVWTVAFYWWFRDDPARHDSVNEAELRLIGAGQDRHDAHLADAHSTGMAIPWLTVLTSPNVWLMGAIMMVGATLFYMQFQWFPTYLKEARDVSEQVSGWLTGAMMIGGAAGSISGGLLVDFVNRTVHDLRWRRRLCGGGSLMLAAASVAAAGYCDGPVAATACNAAALFFVQLAIPTWWTVVAEISGRHGASMWGLMNSLGGLGLMVTTFAAARFIDLSKQAGRTPLECWNPVFAGVAVGLAVGAVCWLMVDATRSIVGETP